MENKPSQQQPDRLAELEKKYKDAGLTYTEFREYNILKGKCPACGDTGMMNSAPHLPFPVWIPCPECVAKANQKHFSAQQPVEQKTFYCHEREAPTCPTQCIDCEVWNALIDEKCNPTVQQMDQTIRTILKGYEQQKKRIRELEAQLNPDSREEISKQIFRFQRLDERLAVKHNPFNNENK